MKVHAKKTAFLDDALFSSGFPMRAGEANIEDENFDSIINEKITNCRNGKYSLMR